MPIYEFRCKDCGQVSELLVLKKDETINCKACNGNNLEKLMSAHNTMASGSAYIAPMPGGCCGSPNSCGNPGSCCSG